ncbi:MAG: hypothetical protein LBG06_07990 [Deltaproteobacteria bacterium]|nr:hypothetical protein [Deltaproteobacteria bacterium]
MARNGKSVMHCNDTIRVEGIPLAACDYVLNGSSAIGWITERYQIAFHKDSEIRNDPTTGPGNTGSPGTSRNSCCG